MQCLSEQQLHSMNVRHGGMEANVVLAQDLWQDALDDNMGDETKAKQQYDRIMQSVARQTAQRRANDLPNTVAKRARMSLKRARKADSEVAESISSSDSERSGSSESSSQSHSEQSSDEANIDRDQVGNLKWMKPGALSRSLGVRQCVLRNWAKANVVRTMISPGGHRLFNIKSVQRHMEAAQGFTRKVKVPDQTRLPNGQQQIIVYMRLDDKLDQAQLRAISDQVQAQLRQHLQSSCMENELQNSLLIFELETVSSHNSERLSGGHLTDTPGTRRLLQAICNRKHSGGSLVVLRVAEDISYVPSTYSLFMLLCRSMGATVKIIPDLIKFIPAVRAG